MSQQYCYYVVVEAILQSLLIYARITIKAPGIITHKKVLGNFFIGITMGIAHENISLNIRVILFFCLIQVTLLLNPRERLMAINLLRIGTGGETGVYYPVGKLIARGIAHKAQEKNSPLAVYIAVAQNSAGSVENVRAISSKEVEAGLVQADIAAFAYGGDKAFANISDASSIRAIASLYSEKFQIVVRKDAKIGSFEDLKGKRISIDEEGSGTLAVMRIVLDAYGMKESDLLPLYLKPVFTQDKMSNGQLDGFVMMAGAPMAAITQLKEVGVNLLPIDDSIASNIHQQYPYLFPGEIDNQVYAGIPETPTLEVYALFVVHKDMPEETAYAITESLFSKETSELMREGHPQGKSITLKTSLNGISIPLHPGADRFYREHKVH